MERKVSKVFESWYEEKETGAFTLKKGAFLFTVPDDNMPYVSKINGSPELLQWRGKCLPKEIKSREEFNALAELFKDDVMEELIDLQVTWYRNLSVKQLLTYWYRLDENALAISETQSTAGYRLRHLNEFGDSLFWEFIVPFFLNELDGLSFELNPELSSNLIGMSVSDYETRLALQSEADASRCCWFYRPYEGGVPDV